LLAALPNSELGKLEPHLERVELRFKDTTAIPSGNRIFVQVAGDGVRVEVATIGSEGVVGHSVALGVMTPSWPRCATGFGTAACRRLTRTWRENRAFRASLATMRTWRQDPVRNGAQKNHQRDATDPRLEELRVKRFRAAVRSMLLNPPQPRLILVLCPVAPGRRADRIVRG
jgi:hypothetical protein